MNQLRTTAYSGFIQRDVPRYGWRGAGKDGLRRRQTGYESVTHYAAYNDGLLGKVARQLGIKNVNKDHEIRRIYDYILGYKAPARQAAAPSNPARNNYQQTNLATNTTATTFDTSAYDAQIKKLGDSLTGLQDQLKKNADSYAKSLDDQQTDFEALLSTQKDTFDKTLEATTEKYDTNMASLRNSLAETMSNKQQPSVGVKTSGYTQQAAALTRQGMKGTFGRSGLRIKGIKDKSLNI
jgi:hypothetical protein